MLSKSVIQALQTAHGPRLAGHAVKEMLSKAELYRKKIEGELSRSWSKIKTWHAFSLPAEGMGSSLYDPVH